MTSEWPLGVLARYLTAGGASVDVSEDHETNCTSAVCTGCPSMSGTRGFDWRQVTGAHFDGTYRQYEDREFAMEQAREWAQAHAEKCRAMPRP